MAELKRDARIIAEFNRVCAQINQTNTDNAARQSVVQPGSHSGSPKQHGQAYALLSTISTPPSTVLAAGEVGISTKQTTPLTNYSQTHQVPNVEEPLPITNNGPFPTMEYNFRRRVEVNEHSGTMLAGDAAKLPSRALDEIRELMQMFAYSATIDGGSDGLFNVTFSDNESEPCNTALPPQPIQRVYYEDRESPVNIVTWTLPLSQPLYDRPTAGEARPLTFLEEVVHCPHPEMYPMQYRMWRLFHDTRRQILVKEYAAVFRDELERAEDDKSYLGEIADLGLSVFDIGRPPRVWTVGGPGSSEVGFDSQAQSDFGRCMYTYEEADVLIMTEEEHLVWTTHKRDDFKKNVIIIDKLLNHRRKATTTQEFLGTLSALSEGYPTAAIDIQKLAKIKPPADPEATAVEKMLLKDAISFYNEFRPGEAISRNNAPANFLNLNSNSEGIWPRGMIQLYTLLQDMFLYLDTLTFDGSVGKPAVVTRTPSDIRKCTQFMILAQRGAASSWHTDQNGVYTFLHLEANSKKDDHPTTDDVVKYWPSFPVDQMGTEEWKKHKKDFADHGVLWRPRPDGGIPVLILLEGYMLLQRPGNIHAPVTLTECFFKGGMAWKHGSLKTHLNVATFLAENPVCTNEELPKQMQQILAHLRPLVHRNPETYGYDAGQDGQAQFDDQFLRIYNRVGSTENNEVACECSGACIKACPCAKALIKCTERCHDTRVRAGVERFDAKKGGPPCSNVHEAYKDACNRRSS